MKKLTEIPNASAEICESPDDGGDRQVALARKLEAAGHRTISVGRAIVTIERSDSRDEVPQAGSCTLEER